MRNDLGNGIASGPFSVLAGHKYCRLVTFRRNGVPVATPMWFTVDAGRIYMKTEAPSGKLRRIANDSRVEVAPCTLRGRLLGSAEDGRARVLGTADAAHAESVLRRRYGVGRRLFTRFVEPLFWLQGREPIYLEVAPAGAPR